MTKYQVSTQSDGCFYQVIQFDSWPEHLRHVTKFSDLADMNLCLKQEWPEYENHLISVTQRKAHES